MPRFPLVGKTPSKVSNIYMCTWYSWKFICTYQGGVLSTHRTWWIYSYHILNFSRKMSKFFQSSIPSPPYALCVKLTWTLLSLQNLVLSSITKRGRLKASRPLCKHLGPQGMFRWLMTTFIVTNEFVQLNRSLPLIWSYVKRGPSISLFKKAISVFNSYICQD